MSGDHKVSKITGEAIFAIRPISSSKFLISCVFFLSVLILDIRYSFSNEVRGFAHDLLFPLYKIANLPKEFIDISFETLKTNKDLRKRLAYYQEDNERLILINSQLNDLI